MPITTPRRQFLRGCALAGAGLPVLVPDLFAAADSAGGGELENEFFSVRFDAATGALQAARKDSGLFLTGMVVRATTATGVRTTAEPGYTRAVRVEPVSDALGQGRQLVARCADGRRELDLELRVTLYGGRDALVVEAIAHNVNVNRPLVLRSLEPVRVLPAENGGCRWPGVRKALTNGQMYYDPGKVLDFGPGAEVRSWWNVGLYRGTAAPGLVVGYLENMASQGRLLVQWPKTGEPSGQPDHLGLVAESTYQTEFVLAPGQRVSSDRFVFQVAPNPFQALENYAQMMSDWRRVRLNPPINGWCTWFTFYGDITEAEVLRQAEFIARHLRSFGCQCVQVDDGFYRAFGDWDGNERFAHGMKWLGQRLRELGLTPGIWLAPYVIAAGSPVHREHPEWLLHHADGRLRQIGPGLKEGTPEAERANPKLYSLDISHPGAAQWLGQLFSTMAEDWGYDFFKIDFVEWSLLAADRYHDPSATKAALYRKGVEIMRQAIGPKRHLLDCGPGNVTIGLLDSMRIELDQPPVTWNQYFLQSASSAPAAAKRYYFHNRTWVNDADHLLLGDLTLPQAQAATTIIGLSGGNLIAGDRLTDLDPIRLEILRRAFPAYGHAARPVDLFERDRPEVFVLPVKAKVGVWWMVALFNADEKEPIQKEVTAAELGLAAGKTYVAFDCWNERLFGDVGQRLQARLEPSSVLLLAVHERRGVPQVIGTDRHITAGAVELEGVEWDAGSGTLRGVSLGPKGSTHRVYVYLPREHPWHQRPPFFFHDFAGYTLKLMAPHFLRVQVRFEAAERVRWEVNETKLFGAAPG